MSCSVRWCDVEWWCGAWGIRWCADARCEMWLWNTEWCGTVWHHIKHGGVMREWWFKSSVGCVLWFEMCCGIVWCVIYIWMLCAWCGARCGHDVEWCAEMWWSDLMWITVRCEMWCYVECGWNACVMWNIACCGMLHNTTCGKLRCDAKCGGMELWWWKMWHMQHMQCAVWLLCGDRCETWCNVLWVQMWLRDVKSRCGGVM